MSAVGPLSAAGSLQGKPRGGPREELILKGDVCVYVDDGGCRGTLRTTCTLVKCMSVFFCVQACTSRYGVKEKLVQTIRREYKPFYRYFHRTVPSNRDEC